MAARCRPRDPRAAPTRLRDRPSSRRRPPPDPARDRRGSRAPRSRPGWRRGLVSQGSELEQRLAELDRLRVVHEHLPHGACVIALELVEELHRLEDAERLTDLDAVALPDEGVLIG